MGMDLCDMVQAMTSDAARTQIITVKLRLRDKHSAGLNRQARAVNVVWNYCNETSGSAWTRDRRWLGKFDLEKLTAGASKLLGLHAHSVQGVCGEFCRAKSKAKRAQIRWRGRKSLGWVPFNTGHVKFDGNQFIFNGERYSAMHVRDIVKPGMKFGGGSFNRDSRGNWYLNLPIELHCADAHNDDAIGIDLGLKDLACLSDGQKVPMPSFYRRSEFALASIQRARKPKRLKAIHAKIANRRKDFLHKKSRRIAENFGLIFVGDVSPKKISQTRMAKSLYDAGWGDFKFMISYKAIMHGGRMVEVDERYTTQTCSSCGAMPQSRPRGIAGLGIREWTCGDCNSVHDRDVNAAKNILRIGLDTLAEGAAI